MGEKLTNLRNDHLDVDTAEPQISEVVTGITTPGVEIGGIAEHVIHELKKTMSIDWGVIALGERLGAKGKAVLVPLSPDVSSEWGPGNVIPLSGTPLEWVIKCRRDLTEPNLTKKSIFWTGASFVEKGIVSTAYVPIYAWGTIIGCVIVGSTRRYAYGEGELRALKHAATKLAMYLDNYRTLEESRKKAQEHFATLLEHNRKVMDERLSALEDTEGKVEEQEIINDLAATLSFGKGLQESFVLFADKLRNRVKYDRVSFAIIEGETVHFNLVVSPGDSPPRAGDVYLMKDCGAGWVVEHERCNIEVDIAVQREFPIDEIHLEQGIRSLIRVPLFSREGVFATLELGSINPNAFGEKEQKFLEQLAHQIAPIGEKIYLHYREKERMEFLTAITHEVKTPLTSIISSGSLLSEELKQASMGVQTRLVENVTHSAQHMDSRISQLLELAAIQGVNFRMPTESLSIKRAVEQAQYDIIPAARAKEQAILTEYIGHVCLVRANPQRLEQILLITLGNAVGVTPQGGTIRIRVIARDPYVAVEIQDSGVAFSPEEREDLLKPFHSTEADRHRLPDLRLGIAIAKHLVELHGGSIRVESKADEGNTIAFTLPVAR